jgi:hypothetical protein
MFLTSPFTRFDCCVIECNRDFTTATQTGSRLGGIASQLATLLRIECDGISGHTVDQRVR